MDYKITIIGAGVVGLAIAEKLSHLYSNIVVIEKHLKFGQENSRRNSEVIHSGIYYPSNTLKAKLCVRGKELLFKYCSKHNIKYKKCGKLVISNKINENKILESILNQSKKNNVLDGRIIEKDEIQNLEPNILALSAVYFPSSGIIDSYGLMKNLEKDSIINRVQFVYGSEVKGILKIEKGYCVRVNDSAGDEYEYTSEIVINSGGLEAFNISSKVGLNHAKNKIYFWKGEYFAIGNSKGKLINSLIYPIPNKDLTGLGIHATIDLSNGAKLGPNAIFLKNNNYDYKVSMKNKELFFSSAKRFLPFLELEDLYQDQVGIRPKLQKPGDLFRDFIIRNENDIGFKNFINLLGIESPGLTSCLAIAEYVENLILD